MGGFVCDIPANTLFSYNASYNTHKTHILVLWDTIQYAFWVWESQILLNFIFVNELIYLFKKYRDFKMISIR